jgi:ATP-dependent Lon protease
MTRRDHVAVERIASGLIKLLYPHGAMSGEEMHEAVSLACEMRQRVHNQLAQIAPGEFKPRLIGFGGMPEYSASDLRSPSTDILPSEDRLNTEAIVGAVTGLAVATQDGAARDGDLILIQVSAFAGTPTVQVTGLHGSVLSDSVKTAYNIVRTRFREFGIAEKRLREQTVAVHLVRIAEPKEGPSAGLAFVVGIISALTGRAVKAGCALTGEVTLHGEVTGVGGIPLKVRAAIKSGRKLIILPAENAKEIGQIPDDLLSQVTIVPVRSIEEAIGKVLEPGSAASPAIGE